MLRSRGILTAAVAIVTFFVFAFALLELPSLPDTDSYFHLAVAKLYAEQGLVDGLPWARFSAMHETFGDKELLFHLLLIPFTSGDATTGGRLAIAVFNAAIAGVITWIAVGELGPFGALIAPLLYLTAPYFWIRTMRLRPELLSLMLFLLIAAATARRKLWTVAALSVALTLSHTAFHVLAAMAVLWFLATREWKPAAATLAGVAIGILVHPHFPDNLRIWFLQNVTFLRMKDVLDVGAEIHPPQITNLLLHNAGWWILAIAAIALWKRKSVHFLVLAAVFLVLQLMMERMSTYFFPFATLALAFGVREGKRWLAPIFVIAILVSIPFSLRTARALAARLPPDVERDYAAFGASIPPGAKIAARWGATDAYVFFAPQGRYLNVLDPVFMAVPHPDAYQAQRRMFAGAEPDIARVAKEQLDSDYIAFARWEMTPAFLERVRDDPNLVRVYDGYNVLLRVR